MNSKIVIPAGIVYGALMVTHQPYFKKQQVKAKPKVSNKPSEMKQHNKPALRTIK